MLHGIDISNWQGSFNSEAVPADFVIIQATNGLSRNAYLDYQVKHLGSKRVGLYHFVTLAGSYKQEADNFIHEVKRYGLVGKAVLAVDFEAQYATQGNIGWLNHWLDYVYSVLGVRPMVYTALSSENYLSWGDIPNKAKLWVAQYNNYNPVYGYHARSMYGSTRHWKSATVFQYTAYGRLNGFAGNLDFNVFYGSGSDWDALAKGKATSGGSSNASKKEDEQDLSTWHVKVPYNVHGGCLITKSEGAIVYKSSDLKESTGKKLKYNTSWLVYGNKDGALHVGSGQWIDSRSSLLRLNGIAENGTKAVAYVTSDSLYTQNELNGGAKGIKHLPKQTRWLVYGRKGKYLIVGNEKTGKYINGSKVEISL